MDRGAGGGGSQQAAALRPRRVHAEPEPNSAVLAGLATIPIYIVSIMSTAATETRPSPLGPCFRAALLQQDSDITMWFGRTAAPDPWRIMRTRLTHDTCPMSYDVHVLTRRRGVIAMAQAL